MLPLALAIFAGAWFGVGFFLRAEEPRLGPVVIITPGPSPPPAEVGRPTPRPSEAATVPGPAPKPAGECDPDADPGDADWCGPGYGDDEDD